MKDCTFFDFFLEKHYALMPILFFFLWKKRVWELCVFDGKCLKSKIPYTIDSFFHFLWSFLHKHAAFMPIWFIFWKKRHESVVFLTEMTKIKNKLLTVDVFFSTFLIFSPKTRKSHAHCIFFEKHRYKNVVFLMKNVQNQKCNIISTSFFVTFYGTFRWLNAPNSLWTETRKKILKKLGATRY